MTPSDIEFKVMQQRLAHSYTDIFLNKLAERTVVIVPSLTLDHEMLNTLKGSVHYEERLLCMLMLLRMPRTHVIYITSVPVDPSIVDYYLHLLPGITGQHARKRLTLLSCYDASHISLIEKILKRPRLIQRIRESIKYSDLTHLSCFNVTNFEKQLSLLLNIPIYGCDPNLLYLGTKTGSRRIFKKLGIPVAAGFEELKNEQEIALALAKLKQDNPTLKKAVVKINDGFSGEGNALFRYEHLDASLPNLAEEILKFLPAQLSIVAAKVSYTDFLNKFCSLQGIVEEFIDGEIKESPSVQCRINPLGMTDVISTHDQLLGGESGQVFIGATFPANLEYTREIGYAGKLIAEELRKEGVMGRFAIDFLSVKHADGWKHYAIEINLRKGGTTHPFLMLQFLTEGEFNWEKGEYLMPNGQSRCYFASDNVVNEKYKGLSPHDLIDIAICNNLQYDGARQEGVMFHMMGALSQYGKLGMVCIAKTKEDAEAYFNKTLLILDAAVDYAN